MTFQIRTLTLAIIAAMGLTACGGGQDAVSPAASSQAASPAIAANPATPTAQKATPARVKLSAQLPGGEASAAYLGSGITELRVGLVAVTTTGGTFPEALKAFGQRDSDCESIFIGCDAVTFAAQGTITPDSPTITLSAESGQYLVFAESASGNAAEKTLERRLLHARLVAGDNNLTLNMVRGTWWVVNEDGEPAPVNLQLFGRTDVFDDPATAGVVENELDWDSTTEGAQSARQAFGLARFDGVALAGQWQGQNHSGYESSNESESNNYISEYRLRSSLFSTATPLFSADNNTGTSSFSSRSLGRYIRGYYDGDEGSIYTGWLREVLGTQQNYHSLLNTTETYDGIIMAQTSDAHILQDAIAGSEYQSIEPFRFQLSHVDGTNNDTESETVYRLITTGLFMVSDQHYVAPSGYYFGAGITLLPGSVTQDLTENNNSNIITYRDLDGAEQQLHIHNAQLLSSTGTVQGGESSLPLNPTRFIDGNTLQGTLVEYSSASAVNWDYEDYLTIPATLARPAPVIMESSIVQAAAMNNQARAAGLLPQANAASASGANCRTLNVSSGLSYSLYAWDAVSESWQPGTWNLVWDGAGSTPIIGPDDLDGDGIREAWESVIQVASCDSAGSEGCIDLDGDGVGELYESIEPNPAALGYASTAQVEICTHEVTLRASNYQDFDPPYDLSLNGSTQYAEADSGKNSTTIDLYGSAKDLQQVSNALIYNLNVTNSEGESVFTANTDNATIPAGTLDEGEYTVTLTVSDGRQSTQHQQPLWVGWGT